MQQHHLHRERDPESLIGLCGLSVDLSQLVLDRLLLERRSLHRLARAVEVKGAFAHWRSSEIEHRDRRSG
jgi:hypothetical protein